MNNLQCWVSWLLTVGANIPLPLMPTISTEFQQYVLIMKYIVLSLSSGMVIFLSSWSYVYVNCLFQSFWSLSESHGGCQISRGSWIFCPPSKERSKETEFAQLCPILCDPMDCSLPGSSVHGIFQARILEWVAVSFSRRSSRPRDGTQVSRTVGRRFTVWATFRPL